MSEKISPIAVVRQVFEVIGQRWKRLALPVILLAVVEALQPPFSGIQFMSDPFYWVLHGLPFEILSAPLIVLAFHVLISEEGETFRYSASFVKKVVLFLWYSLIYVLGGCLCVGVALYITVWGCSLFVGGDISTNSHPWLRYVIVMVLMPAVLYASVRFSMVYPLVVDGVKKAVRQSWRLTRSHFFPIVISSIVLLAVPFLLILGGEMLAEVSVMGDDHGFIKRAWDILVSVGVELLMIALLATWYEKLRLRQEAMASAPSA